MFRHVCVSVRGPEGRSWKPALFLPSQDIFLQRWWGTKTEQMNFFKAIPTWPTLESFYFSWSKQWSSQHRWLRERSCCSTLVSVFEPAVLLFQMLELLPAGLLQPPTAWTQPTTTAVTNLKTLRREEDPAWTALRVTSTLVTFYSQVSHPLIFKSLKINLKQIHFFCFCGGNQTRTKLFSCSAQNSNIG